jgi:hypothetical protein
MKIADCERAIRISESIFGGLKIKSFVCFGLILNLIRDRSVDDATDVDIGVFYEQLNAPVTIKAFQRYEYKLKKHIKNDVDGRTFYLSFEHRTLPPLDVFAWVLSGGIRYHTYDVRMENRERPSVYIFKGIEANILPNPAFSNKLDKNMVYTNFGPRTKPIFRQNLWFPLCYGALMDRWYPDWLKKRGGQSMSKHIIEMPTCAKWRDIPYLKAQLVKSGAEYEKMIKLLK